jgi:hypothetical protein
MTYNCLYCSRTFATPYALKRHISDKHQYISEEGESSHLNVPYEEPGLWDDDLPITYSEEQGLWNDDLPINYSEDPMVRSLYIAISIVILKLAMITCSNF